MRRTAPHPFLRLTTRSGYHFAGQFLTYCQGRAAVRPIFESTSDVLPAISFGQFLSVLGKPLPGLCRRDT